MNERYRYGYGEDFPNRDFPFSRKGAMTDRRDEEPSRPEVDVAERADEEDPEERQAERMREAHSADEPRASDPGATMPFQRVSPARVPPAPPARDETIERGTAQPGTTQPGTAQPGTIERGREGTDAAGPVGSGPDDSGVQRPAEPTRRESIFDIGDEEAEPAQRGERPGGAPEGEPAATGAGGPTPVSRAEERPPIALGPPARTPTDAPAPGPMDSVSTTEAPAPQAPADRPGLEQAPPTPSQAPATAAPAAPAAAATAPAAPASDGLPRSGEAAGRPSLLAAIDRDSIRSRFVDIQAGFVDEPRQAVQEAEHFVDELVHRLVEALGEERAKLRSTIDDGSTEDLRLALRGYRAFVDKLLSLTM